MPFNDQFHKELHKLLLREPKGRKKEYETHAEGVLSEAFELLYSKNFGAAVIRAETALEVGITGFLLEREVVSKADLNGKYTMKDYLGDLFDAAVTKDSKYKGPMHTIFDPRISTKILSSGEGLNRRNRDNRVISVQRLRNREAHGGVGTGNGRGTDYFTARVACEIYSEALNYIFQSGWNSNASHIYLASDVLTFLHPELSGSVPAGHDTNARNALESALHHALRYIDGRELKVLQARVPPSSWAYDIIKRTEKK